MKNSPKIPAAIVGGDSAKSRGAVITAAFVLCLAGCVSSPNNDQRSSDNISINVTVLPVAGQAAKYELQAVVEHRNGSELLSPSGNDARKESDSFNFPHVVATLDGERASLALGSSNGGTGSKESLRISRQGDRVLADYEVVYADTEGVHSTKGRIEVPSQ